MALETESNMARKQHAEKLIGDYSPEVAQYSGMWPEAGISTVG
jgi:hypothetical protein